MNVEEMKAMINPIADVLHLRLGLYTPKNKEAKIVGLPNCARKHKVSGIKLDMSMKASYLGPRGSAVLVRVKGDLYIYMAYLSKHQSLIMLVLNAEKLPITPKIIGMVQGLHPTQILSVLGAGIKYVYTKPRNDSQWTKKDVTNVDSLVA